MDREDLDTLAASGLLSAARYAAFLVTDGAEGDEVIVGHSVSLSSIVRKTKGKCEANISGSIVRWNEAKPPVRHE